MSANKHLGVKDDLGFMDLIEMLTQVAEANGIEDAKSLLAEFHVKKLSHLPKYEWATFVSLARSKLKHQ